MPVDDQPTPAAPARALITALHAVFALSAEMLSRNTRDGILSMALSSNPSWGGLRVHGIYLTPEGSAKKTGHVPWSGPASLAAELDSLAGGNGSVCGETDKWTWANSMRCGPDHLGYLVVTADVEPGPSDRFLLDVLAQQTAVALRAAQQTAQLRAADEARVMISARLEAAVGEVSRRTHAHDLMTAAAIGGDVAGLTRTAHLLTQLPVAIVDQFGHLLSSTEGAGIPGVWTDVRMPTTKKLKAAAEAGRSMRAAKLLIAAAKPGNAVLGAVILLDPRHIAGEFESYVLERAAALLSAELGHRRALAEIEMRLRSELVVELVEGLDNDEAYTRSALVGHDLHQPHQVAVIRCDADPDRSWIESGLRSARAQDGVNPLVGQRRTLLIAVLQAGADAQELHQLLKQIRGDFAVSVGLGTAANGPAQIPRAYAEALRALRVRERSTAPDGGTDFSELGLYQIFEDRERGGAVDSFVRQWLGALIDYDTARNSELVSTLSHFLDCGGNYDLAAGSLMIHRSTLRYRLRRIRDLGGLDLGDVDTRLNVHVATRAWHVLGVE
jgi:sugar diacid utilization regulator